MEGRDLFSMKYYSYTIPNPIPRNPKSSAPYNPRVTVGYYVLTFTDSADEFEVKLTRKKLIGEFYSNGVYDMDGNFSQEKLDRFKMIFEKDVSGKKPVQVISN